MQCEILFQCFDLVVGLELLPEADDRIQPQHEKDDNEVFPMPAYCGQYGGDFDHPRDGPPQEREKPLERADMSFLDRVWPVFLQPESRLLLSQSMLGIRFELGKRLLDRSCITWCLHISGRSAHGAFRFGPSVLR